MKSIVTDCFSLSFLSLFTPILFLLLAPQAKAQLYEVPIEEKIEKSDIIMEGQVVRQESYLGDDGEIYTANKIKVHSVLKGEFSETYLTITTWGGEFGYEIIKWSHLLQLTKGETGVFFLENTQVPKSNISEFPNRVYDVYAGQQGFIRYAQNDVGTWIGSEPFNLYQNLERDVFRTIADFTGHEKTNITSSSISNINGIRYFIGTDSVVGTTIYFTMKVNTFYGSRLLYNAGAVLEYNENCFGSNVVANNNLQLQTGGISSNTNYSLTETDEAQDKVKMELETVGSVLGLSTITTSEQVLGTGNLSILDIFENPNISFDDTEMLQLSQYYEGGLIKEFDTILVETDFDFSLLAPQIDSISPPSLRAGVGDILTIYGSGFEDDQPDNGRVRFTHALHGDNGNWVEPLETDYIQWDDDIIRVQVPSVGYFQFNNTAEFDNYAGTGDIRVKIGGSNSNKKQLYIRFAASNDAQEIGGENYRYPFELRNYNGEGGYDIYYTDEFKTLGGGVDAFERALCTLIDSTGVNYKVRELSTIPPDSISFSCKVDYGTLNLPNGTPSAVKSAIFRYDLQGCFDGDTITAVFCKNWEIVFKKSGVDWSTAQGMPAVNWNNEFDLETVALHELLHSLWLEHSNNEDDALYWRQSEYKREVEGNDLEAGLYAVGISTDNVNCPSGKMIPNSNGCTLNSLLEVVKTNNIKVFPNPTNGNATIEITENDFVPASISLHHISGRFISGLPFAGSNEKLEIELKDIPKGVYILLVSDKNGRAVISKITKL